MTDKIYKKLVRKEAGRYRLDLDDDSRVEIIDRTSGDYIGCKTEFHFKKWNEFGVRLTSRNPTAASLEEEKTLENIDRLKVNDSGKDYHLQCYCLDEKKGRELGGLEIETVWESKPKSNKIEFDLAFDDGVRLIYQLPLDEEAFDSPEDKRRIDKTKSTATHAYDKDGNTVLYLPENKIGSVAIYGPKKNNTYRTGKIGHIDRPKAIDAKGCEVWCDLSLDLEQKTLTVTVPQTFVDNKETKYPVIVDPTFGYTTLGGTTYAADSTIIGRADVGPGEVGTVTSIHVGISSDWSSGEKWKCALYTDASPCVLQSPQSEELSTGHGSNAFVQFDVSGGISVTDQNYLVGAWNDSAVQILRDSGGSSGDSKYYDVTYGTWPASFTSESSSNLYSTYATYNTDPLEIAVTSIGVADSVCPGDTGVPVEGNTFESSQGTNGKVEFGNASTYGASTTIVEQTVTAWTDTEITITAVQGGLTSSQNWVYVTNDSEERSDGYPFTLKCEWGYLFDGGTNTDVNSWARAMGGDPPDKDDMILRSVSILIGDNHGGQVRVAVYQGGSLATGPDNATLLKDFGQTTGSADDTWFELLHEGDDITVNKTDPLWVCVKGTGNNFSVRYKGTPAPTEMDFQSAEGRFASGGEVDEDEDVAWPSTWPTDSGTFADFWYTWKLAYEIKAAFIPLEGDFTEEDDLSGSLTIGVPLEGDFTEDDDLDGTLSKAVPLSGAFEETDDLSGSLDATVELAGAFEETDDLDGTLNKERFLTGSFEETDDLSGSLDAAVELAGAFEETDDLDGTLEATVELAGAFEESSNLSAGLEAAVELAGAFEETDDLDGTLDATVELAGAFTESSNLSAGLEAAVELAGAFEETDDLDGTLDATVELAGAFEETDDLEGTITRDRALAGAFEETDDLDGTLDATVELAGAFEETDDLDGTLSKETAIAGTFEEADDLDGTLSAAVELAGAFEESDDLSGIAFLTRGLVGTLTETDDLDGYLEAARGLSGSFEETDDLDGSLSAVVELAGAFEESDQLSGFLALQVAWGLPFVEAATQKVNWTRAMGGLSPNIDGMHIHSVSIYVGAQHETQPRIAVYTGGDLATGPIGATLLKDFGQLTGSATNAWITLTTEEIDIPKDTPLWVVIKCDQNKTHIKYTGSAPSVMDYQSARGRWNSTALDGSPLVAYPGTWPTDAGGSFGNQWISSHITYGIEVDVPLEGAFAESSDFDGSLSATVELAGVFEETDDLDGSLSATVELAGAFEETDDLEGTLLNARELVGAFEELDQLIGSLEATVELAGAFEETDDLDGTLDATVELAGAFEETDDLDGTLSIAGFEDLAGAFTESSDFDGSLSATVELAGAFEETDDLDGTLDAAVELAGAFEETDDLEGLACLTKGLVGAFEESDRVEGSLDAEAEMSGAFEELDQVVGTLEAIVELAGAFEESDDLSGALRAANELVGAFEELDQVAGSIEIAAGLVGGFAESSDLSGTLDAVVSLSGGLTETDNIAGSMDAVVELAGELTESDDLSAALETSVEMAAAFTESDDLSAGLEAAVELAGGFTETDDLSGDLTAPQIISLAGGFEETDQLVGDLKLIEILQGAFTELDNLTGSLEIPGQITTSNVLGRILTTEGPKGSVLTVSGPKGLAIRR
ncbi:MAG: hypothetical protein GY841_13585 [FCB group bacterium]|nr:hypothetical protein [FCB group bacterium]